MILLLFLLCLLLSGVMIYVGLKYAWANYPETKGWNLLRFGSTFLCGVLWGIFLFHRDHHGIEFAMLVLLVGLGFTILFTFGYKHRLMRLIPKREEQSPPE